MQTPQTCLLFLRKMKWLFILLPLALVLTGISLINKQPASENIHPANLHLVHDAGQPANPPANFKHQVAMVNGVHIHYVIGGRGEPLVLLHGFGQNW